MYGTACEAAEHAKCSTSAHIVVRCTHQTQDGDARRAAVTPPAKQVLNTAREVSKLEV